MHQIMFIHSSLDRDLDFIGFMDIIITAIINMEALFPYYKLDYWTVEAYIFFYYLKTNHIFGKENGMVFY